MQQCTSQQVLETLFKGSLCYPLQVICCISDDVFDCMKPSFNGNFEFSL
jgi:hypothetical protein